MTFISYAQNYEDVMLYRALRHIEKGFYIDVGANDPVAHSVTKAFYDLGWRGLNIEPVRPWFEKLQSERPEDINLQVAASDRSGELRFFEVVGTGLSTCNEETARRHASERGFQVHEYVVPTKTLTEICPEYAVREVHFLKIDVEGAEAATLHGLDLGWIRPWIIVVEATVPSTQVLDYQEWEQFLTGHGYHFVYFDGLNRFYTADEHKELNSAFGAPPNVFDEFITANEQWLQGHLTTLQGHLKATEEALQDKQSHCQLLEEALNAALDGHQLELTLFDALRDKRAQCQQLEATVRDKEAQRQQLEATVRDKEAKRQQLEATVRDKEAQRQHLEAALSTILNSRSWRITKPLRWLSGHTIKLHAALLRLRWATISFTKSAIKVVLHRLAMFILAKPRLRGWALKGFSCFPNLKARLKLILVAPVRTPVTYSPQATDELPPRAKQVWRDLMQAREQYLARKEQIRQSGQGF